MHDMRDEKGQRVHQDTRIQIHARTSQFIAATLAVTLIASITSIASIQGCTSSPNSEGSSDASVDGVLDTTVNRLQDADAREAFDVVVVGAGTGGIGAAIQAARLGRTVALIEETGMLGGQMSTAAVTSIDTGFWGVDSGIFAEFETRIGAYYAQVNRPIATCYWAKHARCYEPVAVHRILSLMIAEEPRIQLRPFTRVTSVRRRDNLVTGIRTLQGRTKEISDLDAKILIDATEWGDLLPLAEIPYRLGNRASALSAKSGSALSAKSGSALSAKSGSALSAKSGSDELDSRTCVQANTSVTVLRKYPNGAAPDILQVRHAPPGYRSAREEFGRVLSPVKDCPALISGQEPGCYDRTRGDPHKFPINWRTYVGYRGMPDSSNPDRYDFTRPDAITLTGNNLANDLTFTIRDVAFPAARRLRTCESELRSLQFLYYVQTEIDPSWSVATDQGYADAGFYHDREWCPQIPSTFEAITRHFPPILYVRESRRLVGVQTLTGYDIERIGALPRARKRFEDSVAVGDYPVDLHGCDQDKDLEPPESRAELSPRGGPFQIPIGVFIPADVDGFLAAEKNISVTRLANGAIRLQPITMMAGQAVGALAAIAVTRGIPPRQVPAILVQDELTRAGLRIAQEGYLDVRPPRYSVASVQVATTHGLLSGYPDGGFRPHLPIPRGEAARALLKALGIAENAPDPPVATFQDVPADHPMFAAVETAYASGLLSACGSGRFCPDASITRAAAAVAFDVGLAGLAKPARDLAFSDVAPDHAALHSIQVAFSNGAVTFCATMPDRFCPNAGFLRGDMAVLLTRALVLRAR